MRSNLRWTGSLLAVWLVSFCPPLPGARGEPVRGVPLVGFAAGVAPPAVPRFALTLIRPQPPMVRIASGPFVMGSTELEIIDALADCVREPFGHRCSPTVFRDELPRRTIHLGSFWIDRHEVTVEQYEVCVRQGACESRPHAVGQEESPRYPVTRVTWYDARRYCEFRGLRLPTETEFERAARGSQGRKYPWGQLFNRRVANGGRFGWDVTDDTDGYSGLAPVGSFPAGATPEGIVDLGGNVAEWVADRYSVLPTAVAGPMARSPRANLRVLRGGSYARSCSWMRGAARQFAPPGERSSAVGFRCARSARGARGVPAGPDTPVGGSGPPEPALVSPISRK